MRHPLLMGLTVGFLLAVPMPWISGEYIALSLGSGESVSVRNVGMVTCPELLKWSPWQSGSGELAYREWNDARGTVTDSTPIVGWRIGRDTQWFAELTFYQARYNLPDGSFIEGPAYGPQPLVSVNERLAAMTSTVALALAVLCLLLYQRRSLKHFSEVKGACSAPHPGPLPKS